MATTLATMEDTTQNTTLPTASLVGEENVETPAPPLVSTLPEVLQSTHIGVETPTSLRTKKSPQPEHLPLSKTISSVASSEARAPPSPASKETPKAKYRATPYKKGANSSRSPSPPRRTNKFSILHSFDDEEVESLINRARQTRKTIHPRLLGTNGRDIEPGGFKESELEPPPISS